MSELSIEYLPVNELKPYDNNSHTHTQEQIELITNSMRKFGFTNPILIDENKEIIAGHARLESSHKVGFDKVPTITLSDLTEDQKRAYVIADNQLAKNGSGWDLDKLKLEIQYLDDVGFDTDLLGFDDDFIGDLIFEEVEGLTPEDAVPEVPEEPVSKLGDLWLLDGHRVLCGDSTSIEDVDKLIDGNKVDMVFTSPPYNGDTHLDYGKGQNKKLYENETDKWTSQEYISFCHQVLTVLFDVTNGFVFWNVMYNAKSRHEYIKVIYPFVDKLWETIIWKKIGMPIAHGLTRNFEFIYVFKNGEQKHLSKEFNTESNFWDINNIGSQDKNNHRACYPVALPKRGISIATETNDCVFDPFLGSGSTLMAADKIGRICYGNELDERYVDVIIKRWQDYTGKQAILESTGETYDALKSNGH